MREVFGDLEGVGPHAWKTCQPHGGLQPSFKKSSYIEKIDFPAISATVLVTYYADSGSGSGILSTLRVLADMPR